MAKLTKEQIAERRKRMQEEARKSITKSEQLNLRIDEESLTRLYAFAAKSGKPVGTLVREWTIERLTAEEKGESPSELASIIDSLNSLHSKVDRWDYIRQQELAERVGESASKRLRSKAERQVYRMPEAS